MSFDIYDAIAEYQSDIHEVAKNAARLFLQDNCSKSHAIAVSLQESDINASDDMWDEIEELMEEYY